MDFRLSALQRELADGTREVLDGHCPPGTVRAAWDKPDAAREPWAALAGLGLLGALADPDSGGLGLTVADVLPAIAETGRAAVPGPVVESALVAVPLLTAAGRDDLVAAVATGDAVLAAAPAGEPVAWADSADAVLVLDRTAVRLVSGPAGGDELPATDRSRPLRRLPPGAGELLDLDPAQVSAARYRGTVGTAAQLVGLARRQLELTVGYVGERHQFGVPVGSFQAVKHQLADALIALRFAEPTVWWAGLEPGDAAVATAKTLTSEAGDLVARTAIQCHGAIGYSDEYDLHLFAKRTWALAAAWGTAAEHRRRYAELLDLPRPA